MMTIRTLSVMAGIVMVLFSGCVGTEPASTVPDVTKVLPSDVKKEHNLGPTGLKGWMHVDMIRRVRGDMTLTPFTDNARQIYVTTVQKGSPADGIVQVGDVIMGIGDKLFESDPRVALANAINESEKTENGGSLKLLCWRPAVPDVKGAKERPAGSTTVRELKLKVLGTYSATAPYDCPKSEAILKQTIDALITRKADKKGQMNGKLEFPYLALLATGEKEHFEIAKKHVLSIAAKVPEPGPKFLDGIHVWGAGYRLILLSEYYLMTKDETVLPAIKNTALQLAMGQCNMGVWGHNIAEPKNNGGKLHGRLGGYAHLNQPSIACLLGLFLAQKCGVDHPDVTAAIKRTDAYFKHWVGKGAIPYGYGPGREYLQSNNGMSGIAATAYATNGDRPAATFFSRMSAGAHTKVEVGHTGPFFNSMWTGLGANVAGPKTYSEFFKRWTPLRTLNREWNGGFAYQSPGGGGNNYRGLSATAAMALHFALPKRTLVITGRGQDESLWLKGEDAVAAADVWSIDYKGATDAELLNMLGHDLPMVRAMAADEYARRGSPVDALKPLLKGSRNEKIGACKALSGLAEKSLPVSADLVAVLTDEKEDPWVRTHVAGAIANMGTAGHSHLPVLVKMIMVDRPSDPHRYLERYLGGSIGRIIMHEEFDRTANKEIVFQAANRLMGHPHQHARIQGAMFIEDITFEDFHRIADTIVGVILNDNPEFTNYHRDKDRQIGLRILERFNIEEGIPLAIETIEVGHWGLYRRLNKDKGRLAILKKYGANVKPYLPKLKAALKGQRDDEFKEIENLTETRKLISLEEAKKTERNK